MGKTNSEALASHLAAILNSEASERTQRILKLRRWIDESLEHKATMVHDDVTPECSSWKGGVIWVNRRKLHDGRWATANEKNVTEELVSRGIFNSWKDGTRAVLVGEEDVSLIGYEAPLLRKSRNLNEATDLMADGVTAIAHKSAMKCDLIGIRAGGGLLAIEVKVSPSNHATNLQHGLLQALAYGYALGWSAGRRSDDLRAQVKACAKCAGVQLGSSQVQGPMPVASVLAAPRPYLQVATASINRDEMLRLFDDAWKILGGGSHVRFDGIWELSSPDGGELQIRTEAVADDPGRKIPRLDGLVITKKAMGDLWL